MSKGMHDLTEREHKVIELIKSGKSRREAMRETGYSEHMVRGAEGKVFNKPQVQQALSGIQQEINKRFGPAKYAQKLVKMTEAKRFQQGLNEFVDDNQSQLKALEIAGKIQDYIKPAQTTINNQVNVQNVLD